MPAEIELNLSVSELEDSEIRCHHHLLEIAKADVEKIILRLDVIDRKRQMMKLVLENLDFKESKLREELQEAHRRRNAADKCRAEYVAKVCKRLDIPGPLAYDPESLEVVLED